MKRPLIALLAVLGLFAMACGLLDEEAATVTYEEEIPHEFYINADEACPPDAEIDCSEEAQPAPEDIELEPIDVNTEIDIVEATGNDDLRNIGQRLRSLEITSIDYDVNGNNLTFDTPEIDIFVAPIGTDEVEHEDTIHLTTMPSVAAGEDDSGSAPVREDARGPSSELFKQMEFDMMAQAQPIVREGQDFPPSGDATIELTINIRITANPTDEV